MGDGIGEPVIRAKCPIGTEKLVTHHRIRAGVALLAGAATLGMAATPVQAAVVGTPTEFAVGRTFGSWYVVSSSLAGVTAGSGRLKGDCRTCEVLPESGGCILDVFTGQVY